MFKSVTLLVGILKVILMRKELAIFKAILSGDLLIENVSKTVIKRTPGDVTEVAHN
jgi:hypothetical protein